MSSKLLGAVWDSGAYAGTALHVLLALADVGHDDGTRIVPAVATVAKKARVTPRQAQRILRKLEADKVLRVVDHEGGGYRHTRHYHMDVDRLRAIGRGEVAVDGGLPPDGDGGERGDTSVTPCENGPENGTGTEACAPPGERGDIQGSPLGGERGDTGVAPAPGQGVTSGGDGVTFSASGVTPGCHPNVSEHQRTTSRARDPAADEAGSRALEVKAGQGQGEEGQEGAAAADEATAAETLAAARAAWPGVKARLVARHGEAAVKSWLGKAWVAKADAEAVLLVVDLPFTAMEARKRFGDDLDRAWGRPTRVAARAGQGQSKAPGTANGKERAA